MITCGGGFKIEMIKLAKKNIRCAPCKAYPRIVTYFIQNLFALIWMCPKTKLRLVSTFAHIFCVVNVEVIYIFWKQIIIRTLFELFNLQVKLGILMGAIIGWMVTTTTYILFAFFYLYF